MTSVFIRSYYIFASDHVVHSFVTFRECACLPERVYALRQDHVI